MPPVATRIIKSRRWAVAALAVHLAAVGNAGGQASMIPEQESNLQARVGAGDVNRSSAAAVSGLQLNASTGSNQASLNLAREIWKDWHLSVTASSPLSMGGASNGGSSATNTNIATLDGLANGFSAKLKLSNFHLVGVDTASDAKYTIYERAEKNCVDSLTRPPVTKAQADSTCDHMIYSQLLRKYAGNAEFADFEGVHFRHAYAITYGIEAGVGYDDFVYYNSSSFAKLRSEDVPTSARGFVGIMPKPSVPLLVTIAVAYQQSYTAKSSLTKCQQATSGIQCVTGAIGSPSDSDKVLLSIDLHSFTSPVAGHRIGIGPQVTYDALAKVAGVDLPVYFIADTQGNLIGGIDLGWTSKQHVFTAGVIVGAPFAIFH
jgi:hypothetical protein